MADLHGSHSRAIRGLRHRRRWALIEISNFEQLDAIRYDTNGDGAADIAGSRSVYARLFSGISHMTGCPSGGCKGYELTRSLDFDDTSSYASGSVNSHWTTGSGWYPVDECNAIFEGNGYTISNLFSKRGGLFISIMDNAEISRLGIVDVDIETGSENDVGGLAGNSEGSVASSYTTGSVSGHDDIGGIVGRNKDSVISSYATGSVSGICDVGGLVGNNQGGSISTSYATGKVSGSTSCVASGNSDVGGLVGNNEGSVVSSYATAYPLGTV